MSGGPLHIRLIGPFEVRVGSSEVPAAAFGGGLARRLLRVLAVAQGEGVSRHGLVQALWGEAQPADPDANLAVQVSRIRRATGLPDAVRTTTSGYELAKPPDVVVDAHDCLRLVSEGRASAAMGDAQCARAAYLAALEQSVGEVLPEDDGEWTDALRARLAQARVEALDGAARLAVDPAEAIELAQQAVTVSPLREPSHLLLIGALARSGDRSGALMAWDRMRHVLADELGIDPSAEAQQLQAAVLRDELRPVSAPLETGPRMPFVGRDTELGVLRDLMTGPPTGIGVVVGPAGSGKSRLLQEGRAGTGRPIVAARAFLAERHEPWSLLGHLLQGVLSHVPDALDGLGPAARAAVVDLLPIDAGGGVAAVGPLEAESLHALRREACIRLLSAVPEGAVFVDDLQWADATSVEVLTHLTDRGIVRTVLLALRPEEVVADGPVARLLRHLDTAHAPRRLILQPLSTAAIRQLAGDDALAAVLTEHTDRSPFAAAEVLDHLRRQELLAPAADTADRTLPPSVIATAVEVARQGQTVAVARRARGRPPVELRLLRLLSLLRREAAPGLLADAAGVSEDVTLDALDGLNRAGLVRRAAAGWAPSHDLVSEAVSSDLGEARRVGLHTALALALRAHHADHAEVAGHLEQAGDPAAAAAFADAVRDRLGRHAHQEARDLADRALALRPAPVVRALLLESRGEARHQLGELSEARTDLRAALALHHVPEDRSRVLAALAMAASGADDLVHGEELAELALVAAGADRAARARALSVASIIDFNSGRPELAEQRASEAMGYYRELGDTSGVADILDGRAMATFLDGRISAAINAFDRVATLFQDAGDLTRVITPRSTRGHALVLAGRPAEGLADITAALELAELLGHPEGRAYVLWHQAEALTALGRLAEAAASAQASLDVAISLGHRGWTSTGHLAVGMVRAAAGDPTAAEAFEAALAHATNFDLFTSWACARLALCHAAAGDLDRAQARLDTALSVGPPLSAHLARLAQVEVCLAKGEDVGPLAAAALEQAESDGWGQGIDRLRARAA